MNSDLLALFSEDNVRPEAEDKLEWKDEELDIPEQCNDEPGFDSDDLDFDENIDEAEIFGIKEEKEEQPTSSNGALIFTETELNEVSSVSNERKFNITKTDLLYNKSYENKAKAFLDNYRFLTTVYNSLDDAKLSKSKIEEFLVRYEELYEILLKLNVTLSKDFVYGKSRVKALQTSILIENEGKINLFIDSLFSLGKVISQYNPDMEIGVS